MLRLFVNGAEDAATTTTVVPADGIGRVRIGRDLGINGFQGQIDEARVFNRALDAGEIAGLARGGAGPP